MIPFLPLLLVLYAIFMNIYTLVLFYKDKKFAVTKKQRISEAKLLSAAAIGGSIGALFGMLIFHHKNRHIKFKFLIPLFIICHYFLLVLIF